MRMGVGTPLKILLAVIATLLCMVLGLVPEIAMWILWGIVNPITEVARLVLIVAYIFAGTGLSIAFAVGAGSLWLLAIAFIVDEL